MQFRLGLTLATGTVAALVLACSPTPRATFPMDSVAVPGTPARTIEPDWLDHPDCQAADRTPLTTRTVTLNADSNRLELLVEVASTPLGRQQGLMCRKSLAPGTGMLFLFGSTDLVGGFWMFNTYVPLDLLYFDRDGRVVASAGLAPCPRIPGEGDASWAARCVTESEAHVPRKPYRTVLELPAGWLDAQGLVGARAPDSWRLEPALSLTPAP